MDMAPPVVTAVPSSSAPPRVVDGARLRTVAHAVTPAWFASVMGTAIVAVAAELLPVRSVMLDAVAVVFWAVATALFVVLLGAVAGRRMSLRAVLADPVLAPTLGVPPMAVMTVGAATLVAGHTIVGADVALVVAATAWAIGTAGGLTAAVLVVRTMVAQHRIAVTDASGAWLLPVVPPTVSATTGAALVAHAPAGEARLDLLLVLYALLGLSFIASLLMVSVVWARLLVHGPGPAERAPSLWVVLGPLGQSITAANLLGAASASAIGAPYADALRAFGVVFGVLLWGFAALWLMLALTLTRHHATRGGVPFGAAWWSFVFPVGTLVTGTSALADQTASDALGVIAVALFAGLAAVWAVIAARSGGRLRARLR